MAKKKGGLLFGIMMGTMLGVLFAPRKGKELRGQVASEIKEGGLGTKTLGNNFKEMGHDMVDTVHVVYENPNVQKQVKGGRKNFIKLIRDLGLKLKKSLDGGSNNKKQKNE